jgi:D-hydroxyproline dehydrogenase
MARDDTVAVVSAGVVGAAVAYALAREGRAVLLLDRAEPGMGGASFGNAGRVASELVEPLPSWSLLFGVWRELSAFGGALDIPLRQAQRCDADLGAQRADFVPGAVRDLPAP